MIHTMLPAQYLQRAGLREGESCRRLMAAVLQTVVDDYRGTAFRRIRGLAPLGADTGRRAVAYVQSTDRTWPFSFENLCEALGIDVGRLRRELGREARAAALPAATVAAAQRGNGTEHR